jgi:23S rRNA pseudouridine1911/1915/1917 synthase
MKSFKTHKIDVEHTGLTVEGYLKQVLQYSGRKIQKLTRQKGILLNGKAAYLQKKLKPSDTLRILILEDNGYGVVPEPGDVEILYEDAELLVLNKPANLLVHPAGQTTSGTLANFLAYNLEKRGTICTIRPIHRLDRNTSGCIIFAKDSHSQFVLEKQLKDGSLKRKYLALVEGIVSPPAATIDAPIGPSPGHPNRRSVSDNGESAVTNYRTINSLGDATLLELTLETGRTHQIRVHMAHVGHPVVGDGMYGTRSRYIARQALHAESVTFKTCNDSSEITVNAPLPADIAQAIERLAAEQTDTILPD